MKKFVSKSLLLLGLVLSGCSRQGAEPDELILYCGAGIREAAEALIAAFESRHPDTRIQATYAGSGRLLGQVSALKKGDLFMPGAEWYADQAIEKGLAKGENKRVVAYFVPVLLVAKGNPKAIASVSDLAKADLRVGVGDARACAVGKKTLKILEKNNIPYAEVKRRVVFESGTVNELGVAIQMGNVDAVVVWDATARQFSAHGDMIAIPREQNLPSTIPVVALESSARPDKALAFVEFAASADAQRILAGKGYTVSLDD